MLIKFPRRNVDLPDGLTIWHVKVPQDSHYDLTFNTRAAARRYKRALAESRRGLQPVIVQHQFEDGYMTDKAAS